MKLDQLVKQMILKKSSHTASYMYTIDNWFLLIKMQTSVTLTIVINAENAWESYYGRRLIEIISDLEESLHASLKYMYCFFLVAKKEYKETLLKKIIWWDSRESSVTADKNAK